MLSPGCCQWAHLPSDPPRKAPRKVRLTVKAPAACVVFGLGCRGCRYRRLVARPRPARLRTLRTPRTLRCAVSTAPAPTPAAQAEKEPWLRRYLVEAKASGLQRMHELFLDAVQEKGLKLYPKQFEAIEQVFGHCHVVLNTPTGSGKSLVATAMLFRAACERKRAYYTCPVKALVSEKFFALCKDFGSQLVGMATGDVSINSQAPVVCCTAEVLANVALREGESATLSYAVMDEFHFYADRGRGYAWEVPLFRLPQVTFLLMSATMGENPELYANVRAYTGREVHLVNSEDRPVPLDWSYSFKSVRDAILDLVSQKRSPVYVVSFTQQDAATLAQSLVAKEFAPTAEEKLRNAEALRSTSFDSPYGDSIRALLLNGIGLHHAGLLPKYRLLVEQMAQNGLLTCICGTDTLGVGVNVPIRSVLFTQLCKYNGEITALLSARDFHQIAGRAGRKGFDTEGSVVAVPPPHEVYNLQLEKEIQAAPSKKEKERLKRRLRSPKGNFVQWNQETFEELSQASPEALRSQFQLSQGHVLSLLQGAQEHDRDGRQELDQLIGLSLCGKKQKEHWTSQVELYIKALSAAGLVEHQNGDLKVETTLQRDFLLMEDVSLFLVDLLPLLQWTYSAEPLKLARAVLSVVEAVCEGPIPVLRAQARVKGRKEPRLPCEDLVLPAYDAFLKRHPWVDRDALQPKAIALEMYDDHLSFNDFLKQLSRVDKTKRSTRQEGLLLRYLSQVHKTMRHNIPDEFKSEEVLEIEAYLLAVINSTDSSLLREWEALKVLESMDFESNPEAASALAERSLDDALPLAAETELDFRTLRARARVETLRFARYLATGRWREAAKCQA
ncbi:unnamed protein product, partial [Effrenium voratum]